MPLTVDETYINDSDCGIKKIILKFANDTKIFSQFGKLAGRAIYFADVFQIVLNPLVFSVTKRH